MAERTIASLSVEARILYDHLITIPVGGEVSYAALSALIETSVQVSPGRGALNTARRMAERDNQIVFRPIRGAGLLRLNDVEIVDTGDDALASIRRKAKSAARTLTCVDYLALPEQSKIRHNTTLAILAVQQSLAQEKTLLKLGAAFESKKRVPTVKETVQQFLASLPEAKGKKEGD